MKPPNTEANRPDDRLIKKAVLILVSLLLISIALIALYHFAEKRAEIALTELINNELSPNAEIVIDDFSLSLFPIGIHFKGIRLQHSEPFNEIVPQKPGDIIRTFSAESLSLSGIRLFSLLKKNSFHLNAFQLDGAEIELVPSELKNFTDSSPLGKPLPITISEILIDKTNITFYSTRAADSPSMTVRNFSGLITSFSVDDPARPRHSEFDEMELQIDYIEYFTDNQFYNISLESFQLSTKDDHIIFKQFHLNPLLSAYEMALQKGYQLDKFDIEIPGVIAEQISLRRWLIDDSIFAEKITLSDPSVSISRDRSLPMREGVYKMLLHRQIMNLPMAVNIDTITVKTGFLQYYEGITVENRAGSLSFHQIDLNMYQVNNTMTTDSIFADATAKFMDHADFDLQVAFSVDETAGHRVSGSLGEMEMSVLNTPLEGLVLLKLESGNIQRLNFGFRADDEFASGSLLFIYRDLELRFLDSEHGERRRDRIRSFIANTFAIRSGNPVDDPRTGEIAFERDKEKSMFNFWLNALASGLEDTVKR